MRDVDESAKHPTARDWVAKGYAYESTGRCRGKTCGAEIEWWRTPKGKSIPLDAGTLVPHHGTCPNVRDFR